MNKLRFLHISDLHISAADYSNQKIVLNKLIEDIKKQGPSFSAVFFTGDIAAKSDYSSKNEVLILEFINEIIDAAGISKDAFFTCPGNHDFNVNALPSYLKPALETLDSNEKVDELFEGLAKGEKQLFSGFADYNSLIDKVNNANSIINNSVFRTYQIKANNINIGIACLNSAWRATGKPQDYDNGKLIIGRKQLEQAAESIKDAQIKIGLIHHPFSWLSHFEQSEINRISNQNFDIFLHGHIHDPNIKSTQTTLGNVIVNSAGCLYQSREHYNGYTIIELSIGEQWEFFAREYYPSRNCFDVATRLSSGGTYRVLIGSEEKQQQYFPTEEFITHSLESANSYLLAHSVSNIAPKDIRQIFVEPPLSKIPEKQISGKENESKAYLRLNDLISSTDNLIFVGNKEAGKTTILHFLAISTMQASTNPNQRFGGYIDFSKCRKTNAGFLEAICNFGGNSYRRSEIINLLNDGLFLICIDNIKHEEIKDRRAITDFMALYPKNRFVFSTNESVYEALGKSEIPEKELKSTTIHIHNFTRKHSRELTKRWYGVEENTPIEKILTLVKKLNIPRNPFILSVLLWINEKNIQFLPVNQSEIIDVFIDGLLEKLNEKKERSRLDSNFKRYFLRELAYEMHVSQKNTWTYNELETYISNFFRNRSLVTPSSEFLQELFQKGILISFGEHTCFKFDCIRSFFLSTKMEDKAFLEYSLMPENFIHLKTEFDYYTGRKRDQAEILEKALATTKLFFNEIEEFTHQNIDEEYCCELSYSALKNISEQAISPDEIFGTQPTQEEREDILDNIDEAGNNAPTKRNEGGKINHDNAGKKFITSLITLSIILRNSELIEDAELKSNAYKTIMDYWAHVFLGSIAAIDKISEGRHDELRNFFTNIPENLIDYIVKMLIPNAVFSMIYESIGTAKLELIIKEHYESTKDNPLTNLLHTVLYTDLALPNYTEYLAQFIKTKSNKYYLELIFIKLVNIYNFKANSTQETAKIKALAGDIYVKFNASGNSLQKSIIKNQFLQNLESSTRH